MQFKVKPASLITVLLMVLGTAVYFENEISAQGDTYEIGQSFGGGVVVYVDNTDKHGLIAATEDQSDGAGWHKANTICENYRGGGYSDWYLPTKNELYLLYRNLHKKGIGGFAGDSIFSFLSSAGYWSSTIDNSRYTIVGDARYAWYQDFSTGEQSTHNCDFYYGKNDDFRVRCVRAFSGISALTTNQEESNAHENKLPNRELSLGVDYSGYDTLAALKTKNPDIIFSQIKYPYDNEGRTQFKTVEGPSPITTEAYFTFNSKGRLVSVIIKKEGAALNVYEPLVEKYTKIYGEPKESTPFTTDLSRQNCSYATCFWENDKRNTRLLLVIPLDGYSVPFIRLFEFWEDKEKAIK